jgi:hypothetical protein
MDKIQRLYREKQTHAENEFNTPAPLQCPNSGVKNCPHPLCLACRVAKAQRTPTGATTKTNKLEKQHALSKDQLFPGQRVFGDQYESNVKGRRLNTRGKERDDNKYCGGMLFYDAASQYIHIHNQSSLGSSDTIRAKKFFEYKAMGFGIQIRAYHMDNGIFTKDAFREHLIQNNQQHSLSGVGAHHQNGATDRAIRLVQDMAQAMLIHLAIHWPDEYDPALWPFAMEHATWLYNHTPKYEHGFSPQELFSGIKQDPHILQQIKVFGCPVFVLDPKLQDGHKIPKWQPCARMGQFLGYLRLHASTVGLIQNLATHYVSPQYRLIYNQKFTTVFSGIHTTKHLTTEELQIFLSHQWRTDDHVNNLQDWDITVDGPLPDTPLNWDEDSFSDGVLLAATSPAPLRTANTPYPQPNFSPIHTAKNPSPLSQEIGKPPTPQVPLEYADSNTDTNKITPFVPFRANLPVFVNQSSISMTPCLHILPKPISTSFKHRFMPTLKQFKIWTGLALQNSTSPLILTTWNP